ncbi:HAE1 family hydrophobic/amphiphilic exporter-1 [Halanaerobium saccharolyticum]|uniref:HAE1 family hydrophobic/amphiphilic exporter-1 n=1 Tax=Halanaerobium saccharolyticum TaxID=43595 RepID=A0A4R7YSM3_9FIRM|nr:efflux RND transporter permease subunit [Halanaerobium saccharolyticum]RAK04109.1 HAE1 family hydrophobic/amphiphilic exporter-1 [Halanaerobium saccharolyticum]TDV97883.1 HAE1 family hydrophobic/amphiphilic exporter-1 [Halanaerobium saccharolyticum]TDX50986.1 HAE1 family hydrophobic/amphiphilic exporter-1 [Halanaerobium saccharolyticum]
MKISDISVSRPVTITMIIMAVVLIGGLALTRLPMDLTPEMEVPFLMIRTSYSGATPEEVEESITRPVESTVATIDGLSSLNSNSSEGSSMVFLEFEYGTDLTEAKNDLRDLISQVETGLPDSADEPRIMNYDPNAQPIMELAVAGGTAVELKNIAEDTIQPRLEQIIGVATAEISGGRSREIRINADQEQLSAYNLTLDQIAEAVRASNQSGGLGTVMVGNEEISVRALGEFENFEDLEEIEITTAAGDKVPLSLLADLEDGFQEVSSISYLNGQESIGISIQKQGDSNTVSVANEVRDTVAELNSELTDTDIQITTNNAQYIEDSISSVLQNFIIGGILAVIILFIFLRNFSSTVVIATAIPISVLATFALMYFANLSLNLITLGGIALGVGMLVDNSIVVLENIYRHRALGIGRLDAAKDGASEVATAISASTLTTVAVFIPVIFIEDLLAQLFTPMALTVTFSLLASLFVALTFIPMLSSKVLKVNQNESDESVKKKKYVIYYQKILNKSLKHRYKIVAAFLIFFILFGAGIALDIIPLETEYMPDSDQGTIRVFARLEGNSTIEKSNQLAQDLYSRIEEIPEIELLTARVNSGRVNLTVELLPLEERDRDISTIAEEIRSRSKNLPGVSINVSAMTSIIGGGGGMGGTAIEAQINGPDLDTLLNLGENTENLITDIEGIRNIDVSLERGNEEIHVGINKTQAQNFGFTSSDIISYVNMALSGSTISQLTESGEEIDIILKLKDNESTSLRNLSNIKLFASSRVSVPLSQLATIKEGTGYSSIERENQQRYISVGADIFERPLGEVQNDVETVLAEELNLPSGYTITYGGEAADMSSSFNQLFTAAILAIILVYMVMASQFESLIHPFIIMFTVPLSIIGAVLGLIITGTALSVYGLIGAIMLVGIVVNNAIVMIDYINNRKEQMSRKEAILEAAPIRLRPILMTTLTTVLALVPLAIGIGTGAETQQPMAIVVIGGLLFSTLLTLVVIPVVYDIVDELRNKFVRWLLKIVHKEEVTEE